MQPLHQSYRPPRFVAAPPRRSRRWLKVSVGLFVVVVLFVTTRSLTAHASTVVHTIRSGVSGYCLDLHNDSTTAGTVVDSWSCNNSDAQSWAFKAGAIQHDNGLCLSVAHDYTVAGTPIDAAPCSNAPGQFWLQDKTGFLNPHSGLCLSLPQNSTGTQLVLASCAAQMGADETWTTVPLASSSCTGSEGQKVACQAELAWVTWQNQSPGHEALLNQYTDGAPYEAWCADFVSYVYKQAGYPFTQGEADGWNENNANNIQNMGFTKHDPQSYTPKPGDIAYFDYDGGHVEIVVSGGPTPTFIYGNSGTVDPATGNGQMATNTLLGDGSLGKLIYYLSPNN